MAGRATSSRGRSLSTTRRATTTRTPKLTQVNIAQGEIYIATSRRDGSIGTTRVACRGGDRERSAATSGTSSSSPSSEGTLGNYN